VPKARLTATLEALGLEWREDPSNASHDFERVRMREALRLLDGLGIGAAPIERSARRLARAREAVAAGVAETAQRLVRLNGGLFAEIDRGLLSRVPDEFQIRIFAALLEAFGGASPPARLSQIEALVAQMSEAAHHDRRRATTLGGCRIARDIDGAVLIWREAGRDGCPQLDLQPGAAVLWDQRFAVTLAAEAAAPVRVRALGEDGVRQLGAGLLVSGDPAWRKAPHGALETLPSFWREGRLVAVPYLPWPQATAPGCSAEFVAAKLFSGDPPRVLTQG
jgi:tRNA(Ile)-lysidine synthase